MQTIKIEATNYSPKVELKVNGEMLIIGKSIIEDPHIFYTPIIESIKKCKSKKLNLDIHLEYMNTSSSKLILTLLFAIKEKYKPTDVYIKWFYESGDDDMLDMGLDYESLVSLPIDLCEICES